MVLKARFFVVIPMVLIALLSAIPGAAAPGARDAGGSANLYGEVKDEQGNALPGAKVTLDTAHGSLVAETNAQGQFRFLALSPGSVSVKAELAGFYSQALPPVQMNEGKNSVVEIKLIVNPEDTITLICESPLCVKEVRE